MRRREEEKNVTPGFFSKQILAEESNIKLKEELEVAVLPTPHFRQMLGERYREILAGFLELRPG